MPNTYFTSYCYYISVVCLLPVICVLRHHVDKQSARAPRSSSNCTSNPAACELSQKEWEINVFMTYRFKHYFI